MFGYAGAYLYIYIMCSCFCFVQSFPSSDNKTLYFLSAFFRTHLSQFKRFRVFVIWFVSLHYSVLLNSCFFFLSTDVIVLFFFSLDFFFVFLNSVFLMFLHTFVKCSYFLSFLNTVSIFLHFLTLYGFYSTTANIIISLNLCSSVLYLISLFKYP